MGAKIAIPVEEYLRTPFPGPDREYRFGEIEERTMPDYLHGKIQGILFAFFWALRSTLHVHPAVETRVKVRPDLYLIPDVAVFHPEEPSRLPDTPPLAVIEVLSTDDRMSDVRQKLEQYRIWGVPHVWLVDPHGQRLYACDLGLVEVSALRIPELGLELTPDIVFDFPKA